MTNLTSEFTPLLAAIKALKKAQDSRSCIPVMHHINVMPDAHGRAVLTASDLENYLSVTVPGSTCDCEFTLVRGDLEKALTGGDKGALVKMSVDPGTNRDGTVTVEHGDITVDLETLPVADFPETPSVTVTLPLPLSYDAARGMLTYCSGAMSKEETRYYLRGIYMHQLGETGRFGAVATDGHRLNLAETNYCYGGRGVILRDDAVTLILAMLGSKGDGDIVFSLPQSEHPSGWIKVTGDGWQLVTREVNGAFPAYERVIPAIGETTGKATLSCESVGAAATRIARITSKRGASIIDTAAGVLRHNGDESIKALSIKLGDMHPSGEVAPVGINPVYLSECMSQIKVFSDTCTVYLSESSPLRVHPRYLPFWSESLTSVLMPMRY